MLLRVFWAFLLYPGCPHSRDLPLLCTAGGPPVPEPGNHRDYMVLRPYLCSIFWRSPLFSTPKGYCSLLTTYSICGFVRLCNISLSCTYTWFSFPIPYFFDISEHSLLVSVFNFIFPSLCPLYSQVFWRFLFFLPFFMYKTASYSHGCLLLIVY